jgi:hypothetical protein
MEHGFAGLNQGGEMKNSFKRPVFDGSRGKDCLESASIRKLALDEFNAWGKQLATSMAQVIEYDGLVAVAGEEASDCTTYIPGASCYQHFHKKNCPFDRSLGNLKSNTVGCAQTAGRSAMHDLSNLRLTPRSYDGHRHVPGERLAVLALTFRGGADELRPRLREVDSSCRAPWMQLGESGLSKAYEESEPPHRAEVLAWRGIDSGFPQLKTVTELKNKLLIPFVCIFLKNRDQASPLKIPGVLNPDRYESRNLVP